jgi:hypothetical protein
VKKAPAANNMLLRNQGSSLLGAAARANLRRVKKDTLLRDDPHRLARVALSRAELSEWLARHTEVSAKEDVSQ